MIALRYNPSIRQTFVKLSLGSAPRSRGVPFDAEGQPSQLRNGSVLRHTLASQKPVGGPAATVVVRSSMLGGT